MERVKYLPHTAVWSPGNVIKMKKLLPSDALTRSKYWKRQEPDFNPRYNLADLPFLLELTIDYLEREPELQARLRQLGPLSSHRRHRSSASPRRSRSTSSPPRRSCSPTSLPRRSRSPASPRRLRSLRMPSPSGGFSRRSRSTRSASGQRLASTRDYYSPQRSGSSRSQRTPSPSPTPPPSITSVNPEPAQVISKIGL